MSRFERLADALAAKGAHDPRALAAHIGRMKYGRAGMAALAAKGRAKAAAKHAAEATYNPDGEDTLATATPVVGTYTTENVEDAIAWADAVEEALYATADQHGGDPDAVMRFFESAGPGRPDHDETATRIVESLDPIAFLDPAEPAFEAIVARAAADAVALVPSLRAAENDEPVQEAENIAGRVLEAKGTSDGSRVYRVQILKVGTSKNGNRYTEAVLRRAAHLYDGAKAYDHHRSAEELRSSTLAGLIGSYRNVEATTDGLFGDLHLLPGATHTAEALDRALANQALGKPPLVGISHDVMANFKPTQSVGGRRVREATSIVAVQSADVVADPSAGGVAVHAVEATTPTGAVHTQESEVPVTANDVLAALSTATPEQLAAHGLSRAGTPTTEATLPAERVVESRVTEAGTDEHPKTSFIGRMMIEAKAKAAGMTATKLAAVLPDRVSEAAIDHQIALAKSMMALDERAELTPTGTAVVTRESRDKKLAALDAFFTGDFTNGYRSFRSAWADISGYRPSFLGTEDVNRRIIRESFGMGYDSGDRVTESADTSTWAQLLGDSVTRRVVAEYGLPQLQTWRQIVSDIQPVEDFRTQRVGRMGGYGVLPAVLQGAPYQPLTTPPDEEATYAPTKRGGTEDLTLETIANDDRRVISKIPTKLGRAAAQTLYRFVWDMLVTPVTCTYDSVALFHSSHGNTDTSSALSQTTLGIGRQKMRDQTAYGDTSEVLGFGPKFLAVPNELEELAFQLTHSAVAVPATAAGPSDTPNINAAQNLESILVPYLTDANDWFLIADPNVCPTIELGFYLGRQEPEVFTQSDPSVGSVWNADVFQWKIRHIYGGTALDHRAFYRGVG